MKLLGRLGHGGETRPRGITGRFNLEVLLGLFTDTEPYVQSLILLFSIYFTLVFQARSHLVAKDSLELKIE